MSLRLQRELASVADSGVRNSQAPGIGRLAVLGDLVAWNNLGRNIVFANRALAPLAVFDETAFPHQDEPSQYDLDLHALVSVDDDLLLALNHLGTTRVFAAAEVRAAVGGRVKPVATLSFVEDVERAVAA